MEQVAGGEARRNKKKECKEAIENRQVVDDASRKVVELSKTASGTVVYGITCGNCGEQFTRTGSRGRQIKERLEETKDGNAFCSQACNQEFSKIKRRYTLGYDPSGKKMSDFQALRARMEDNNYRCELSGLPLTPNTYSLDHIVPVANGGDDSASNLQIVLSEINQMKGTMSRERFVELCTHVARYAARPPA